MSKLSEMVERVARAITIGDPDWPITLDKDKPAVPLWTRYVDSARAAIKAMRQPTPDMLECAREAEYRVVDASLCEENDLIIWHAMIDGALEVDSR